MPCGDNEGRVCDGGFSFTPPLVTRSSPPRYLNRLHETVLKALEETGATQVGSYSHGGWKGSP
jgi:hypothetical protein